MAKPTTSGRRVAIKVAPAKKAVATRWPQPRKPTPKSPANLQTDSASPFSDQTFVILGKLTYMKKKEAEAAIKVAGGRVSSAVSKRVDVLIFGEKPGAKLTEARTLGLRIMSEQEFLEAIWEIPSASMVLAESVVNSAPHDVYSSRLTPPVVLAALESAVGNPWKRVYVARHANTPRELLAALAMNPDEEVMVRVAAADNPQTPRDLPLVEARDPKTKPQLLTALAKSDDPLVRLQVAKRLETAAQALMLLAADQDAEIREAVARNTSRPVKALELLASDVDSEIREFVAGCRETPGRALALLAKDKLVDVREAVASNQETPSRVLAELARDRDAGVRAGAARNPLLPPSAFTGLARSKDAYVRLTVARNSNCPPEILERLAADPDIDVQDGVLDNKRASKRARTIALARVARSGKARRRQAVAGDKDSSPETLALLASDTEKSVRLGVASNPNATSETLAILAKDRVRDVRDAAARNVSAGRDTKSAAKSAAQDSASKAKDSATPASMLKKLSKDPSWRIRELVALNTSTPAEVLRVLVDDRYAVVRAAAQANPNGRVADPKAVVALWSARRRLQEATNGSSGPLLEALSIKPSTPVAVALACNAASTKTVLDALVNDNRRLKPGYRSVAAHAAANPNATDETLARLALSEDRNVRRLVVDHPNASEQTRALAALMG